MDLTPYITQLREDLTAAASAGDDHTRYTAAVLGAALEPAVRLTLMTALSDLAAEITAVLDDRVVEVRVDGRDVRVVVSSAADTPRDSAAAGWGATGLGDVGGDISRMTLRLFDQLKGQAERAAAQQGVSLNTWVSQAVQGALRGQARSDSRRAERERQSHNRIQGWVQG